MPPKNGRARYYRQHPPKIPLIMPAGWDQQRKEAERKEAEKQTKKDRKEKKKRAEEEAVERLMRQTADPLPVGPGHWQGDDTEFPCISPEHLPQHSQATDLESEREPVWPELNGAWSEKRGTQWMEQRFADLSGGDGDIWKPEVTLAPRDSRSHEDVQRMVASLVNVTLSNPWVGGIMGRLPDGNWCHPNVLEDHEENARLDQQLAGRSRPRRRGRGKAAQNPVDPH